MENKNALPEGFEYLVGEGMEWLPVCVSVMGKDYTLITTRRTDDEYFRASSNALEDLYMRVKGDFPDRINIILVPELCQITQTYCAVSAYLSVDGKNSDIQAGEVRVSITSTETEREGPYTSALRKARCKVILNDLLDLPSRFFKVDGTPVVYFEKKEEAAEEEEKGLNSIEQKEYDALAEKQVAYAKGGKPAGTKPLKDFSDKSLALWASEKNSDEALRKDVARFIELKEKLQLQEAQ